MEPTTLRLDLSPQARATLTELARRTGASEGEVLRKALLLMEVAVQARDDGHRVGVVAQDGSLVSEVVGL